MNQKGLSGILADEFDNDFKAEVIAAELINNVASAEQIMIVPLGPGKRSYRKDVEGVLEELSDYNNKEYTLITTHKEGIYDMLPEGLFHSPVLPKSVVTQKEVIETIKKHKREERQARRFFLPYEAGINHLRMQIAFYESRMDKGTRHNDLVDLFRGYWDIFQYLDARQSEIFMQTIPLLHDIRDDYTLASMIFEMIFSLPVKICSQSPHEAQNDTPVFSGLGNAILGTDFTTGNEFYDEGEDELVVQIGPLDNDQLSGFAQGERFSKILELLCDYLLPVHLDIKISFELTETSKAMQLAHEGREFNSTLGLSTYL